MLILNRVQEIQHLVSLVMLNLIQHLSGVVAERYETLKQVQGDERT